MGGTNGCLCYELWLLIGANLMNAGCCVETDALCNVADFSGCASLSIAGTSRRGEHLAGHKIMRGKGEAQEEKKNVNSCLFIFSLIYGRLCVRACLCVCV